MEKNITGRLREMLTRGEELARIEAELRGRVVLQSQRLQSADLAFHDDGEDRDLQAHVDLREAALSAGQSISDAHWIRAMKARGIPTREIVLITSKKDEIALNGRDIWREHMGQFNTDASQDSSEK